MPYLIDGSNLLGAMRADRHSDDAKRTLVRMLAAFARTRRTRVTCVFDGPEPASFGRHSVAVVFGAGRAADDIIAERVAGGRGWSVVTADQALAARVSRRHVQVIAPAVFLRELEAAQGGEAAGEGDWEAFFSDPENRLKF